MTHDSTITKTFFFATSCENVWSFLTEKEKLAKWFHSPKDNLKEGDNYSFVRLSDDGVEVPQIWGRVLKMEKPTTLIYTFVIDAFNDDETTVTWRLASIAGGCKLTLVHEGISEAAGEAALPLLMALDKGWEGHVGDLRTVLAE